MTGSSKRHPRVGAFVVAALLLGVHVPGAFAASQTPSGSVTGSITNVHAVSGGLVRATYTTNFSICTPSGYCGWYPHAWQIPASRQCTETRSHLTYVGDTHSGSGTETATDTFRPRYSRVRICLYARQAGVEHFVADKVFTPRYVLTLSLARSHVRQALARRLGAAFLIRSGFRQSCTRISDRRVRCNVSWRHLASSYRGTVTVWVDSFAPTHFHYSIHLVRRG